LNDNIASKDPLGAGKTSKGAEIVAGVQPLKKSPLTCPIQQRKEICWLVR